MTITIKPIKSDSIQDMARLFSTDPIADQCWCMWFIRPVKEFHAVGHEGNRTSFCDLVAKSEHPLGLLGYQNEEPVGGCATGPAERYARAIKTPTYNAKPAPGTWLVPCLFVRKDMRRSGISQTLLEAAVTLASESGATTIEGFPFSGGKKRTSGDVQVGTEALFASCGFDVIRTPSSNRVVMRRTLKA